MFTDVCQVAAHQEMDGNSSQGYYGNSPQHYSGIPSQGYSGISAQGIDGVIRRKDQNVPPVPDFYSTAEKMEETDEYPTQTEHHAYGLPPRTSFSGTSLPTDQNVEIENILNLELDKSEEENILTSLYSFEQTDSYEGETDSIASDYLFNSNYEPRPDPALMLSNQFRSQH